MELSIRSWLSTQTTFEWMLRKYTPRATFAQCCSCFHSGEAEVAEIRYVNVDLHLEQQPPASFTHWFNSSPA